MKMEIYEKMQDTPKEAQKQIGAGRLKGFTDINPMWRIKRLTEVFGPCGIGWWYEIVDRWLETATNGEIKCFVTINLYYIYSDKVSMPIPGTGGSAFLSHESSKDYVSDECFKMALTDAISVACKALGMSADIYYEKDRSKYTDISEPARSDPRMKMITDVDKLLSDFAALRGKAKEEVMDAIYNSQNVYVNPGTPLSDFTVDQLQKTGSILTKWIRKANEN